MVRRASEPVDSHAAQPAFDGLGGPSYSPVARRTRMNTRSVGEWPQRAAIVIMRRTRGLVIDALFEESVS
jgi:hypothetical protein